MIFKLVIFLIILISPLCSICGQTVWEFDFAVALAKAKQNGKPMLLDFKAEWCPPCRKMEQSFWNRSDVGEFSKQIVFVKIDGDKNAELKERYKVKGFPTLILTDSWGAPLSSYVGFGQNADRVILEMFANIPKDFSALKEAGNLLGKNENNLDALYRFAEFYQNRKLYGFSIEIYKKILPLEPEPEKREETLLNLANAQLKQGQLTAALENFENLLKEFPASAKRDQFLYGKIAVHLNRRKLSEAEAVFAQLKDDFPASQWTLEAEKRIDKLKNRL